MNSLSLTLLRQRETPATQPESQAPNPDANPDPNQRPSGNFKLPSKAHFGTTPWLWNGTGRQKRRCAASSHGVPD